MPEVIFTGPAGRVEGRYTAGPLASSPVALILHPHPKHGGTMNNRVVYSLCQTFAKKGFSTLRFNFRGVGRSEGAYDNGEGELADAAAAMDWLQSTHPQVNSFWVAGFSFGAWIAMQLLMRRPELDGFIALSNIKTPEGVIRLASPKNNTEYAKLLYQALRSADEQQIKTIHAHLPTGDDIALAIIDRLTKSSK